jgi:hypothetical protein
MRHPNVGKTLIADIAEEAVSALHKLLGGRMAMTTRKPVPGRSSILIVAANTPVMRCAIG